MPGALDLPPIGSQVLARLEQAAGLDAEGLFEANEIVRLR
jgi:hypothetical protein